MARAYYSTIYLGADGRWNGVRTARSARDHTDTRAGSNGRRWPNGLRLLPGRPTAPGYRVARGGTQGGLNCLTHVLPRRFPTPTEEADGGGGTVDRAE